MHVQETEPATAGVRILLRGQGAQYCQAEAGAGEAAGIPGSCARASAATVRPAEAWYARIFCRLNPVSIAVSSIVGEILRARENKCCIVVCTRST